MIHHYHRLVETPDGNLSKGMRQLNGVYTQKFNPSVGGVTEYQWDKADRLVYLKRANGTSQSFAYNAYGKVTEVVDEKGHKTEYQYGEKFNKDTHR